MCPIGAWNRSYAAIVSILLVTLLSNTAFGQDQDTLVPQAEDVSLDPARRREALSALASIDSTLSDSTCEALVHLLGQVPEALERDLAQALGRCDSRVVTRRLSDVAGDADQSAARRRTAILALGFSRSKEAAASLIRLLEEADNDPDRAVIFDALVQLTGITSYGQDTGRWRTWWREHRNDNDHRWLEHLLGNHGRRALAAEAAQPGIRDQLIETQRQLYRATPESERSAVLARMLDSPQSLTATRVMALDLALKMLTDNQPIGLELRAALIGRLDDPLEDIRQKSATLLRDLADETAADAVAARLLTERETSVPVVRAYLRVVTRLPRALCLDAVMRYLDDTDLRGDAAAALAAAADARLITLEQSEQSATTVRAQIERDGGPIPQFIDLLGKVGDDGDWVRIEGWLDHPDNEVKIAAASAWARSDRPLAALAQRISDPVIQPIAIAAATRRGNQLRTMLALIEHRPEQEQMTAAWQRALVTMASRIEPERIVVIQDALAQHQIAPAIRDQILSAAINRMIVAGANGNGAAVEPNGHDMPDIYAVAFEPNDAALAELLLQRGAMRLDQGNPAQALADFNRIPEVTRSLEPDMRRRVELGVLEARLGLGEVEPAAEGAARLLASARRDGDLLAARRNVLEQFIAAAQRALAADQLERAGMLAQRVRSLIKVPELAEAELWRQIDDIEAKALPAAPLPAPVTESPTEPTPRNPGTTTGPAPVRSPNNGG